MTAAQVEKAQSIELVDLPLPELSAHEVLIEVRACGICGTDLHIYKGEYAELPLIPGHEFSGIVAAKGSAVRSLQEGDRVAVEPNIACNNCEMCLNNRQNFCEHWQGVGLTRQGAMAQYVAVPEEAAFDIGPLTFEQAIFMEPLSCVLHGIERAQVAIGDRVLIIGAGPIGQLLLKTCRVAGACRVDVVDKQEERLSYAERGGACEISSDFVTRRENSYDVVIDATGAPEVLEQSVAYVRPAGRILWFGVPPSDADVSLTPFTLFRKEVALLSSFTSVRNSLQALRMLECNKITVSELVTHRVPLADVADTFSWLARDGASAMKVALLPNGT